LENLDTEVDVNKAWEEMKWREVGENYIMKSFITCTLLQV
jgi:hypothetical protein